MPDVINPDNPYSAPNSKSGADPAEPNMWAFILPFVVLLVVICFYPKFEPASDPAAFPDVAAHSAGESAATIDYVPDPEKTRRFLGLLGLQIVVATGFLIYFRKTYLQQFPLRLSVESLLFGAIGAVIWIGLCELQIESSVMQWLGISKETGARPAFNPFATITGDPTRAIFFVLRFGVLVVIVPVLEELFLRGWLVRWYDNVEWYTVNLKNVSLAAVGIASAYGIITHPTEAIAAIAWFSFISWLMIRTGNLWDCVVAHAVTNLLLGLYVLYFGVWRLW